MQKSSLEAADLAACRALMRGGSRTFFAASLLLPRRIYEPATALYAFCRLADDAIDDSPTGRPAALAQLRDRLDRAYAGRPLDNAADRAFAAAVARHAVPRALPLALLEGFGWDSEGRRYKDLAALHDYAARVAGTVGAMMAVVMGARGAPALARACDLGVAMQITNIARDVGEDARAGRLYLPLDWMRQAGVDPDAWLANPVFSPAIGAIVQRLLQAADFLYERGAGGIADLPVSCRPGIRAAALIYADIGADAARHGYDTVTRRAHVPAARKAALLARSLAALVPAPSVAPAPPLAATRGLVEAAQIAAPPARARYAAPRRTLDDRIVWVFDLFQRLQHEDLRQELGAP
jgi:phytoene synthase